MKLFTLQKMSSEVKIILTLVIVVIVCIILNVNGIHL